MGYRHYLVAITKENLKNYQKFVDEAMEPEENYLNTIELFNKMATEVHELGKYSDEGSALEEYNPTLPEDIAEDFANLKKICTSEDCGFNYVTKHAFRCLIDSYSTRSGRYFQNILDAYLEKPDALYTKEEATNEIITILRHMAQDYTDGSIVALAGSKYVISTSGKYSEEVFSLAHIYKTFDWDNEIMVVVGH